MVPGPAFVCSSHPAEVKRLTDRPELRGGLPGCGFITRRRTAELLRLDPERGGVQQLVPFGPQALAFPAADHPHQGVVHPHLVVPPPSAAAAAPSRAHPTRGHAATTAAPHHRQASRVPSRRHGNGPRSAALPLLPTRHCPTSAHAR